MRRLKFISGALMGLMLGAVGVANAADSNKPIVIPTHNWSSQVVMAYVIGGIFE
ncbi:MAG TPA: glycine/betaine ABC transporter substrate-binding protein, partial [Gammaproteobacteria bacterium]|nr:glycine/betaine ABC transporter substrate-binding protein [Gammaproteobacteria bacterium]